MRAIAGVPVDRKHEWGAWARRTAIAGLSLAGLAGLAVVVLVAVARPAPAASLASPGTMAARPATQAHVVRTVVLARPGHIRDALTQVAALGGRPTRPLGMVGGFAATLPVGALAALSRSAAVRSVTPDAPITLSSSFRASAPGAEPTSVYPQTLGADRVWRAGTQGQGVTVAVLDTGVTPGPDLAGRLQTVDAGLLAPPAPCMNLSGEPDCTDSYGHGTFVAGIVAGNGTSSGGLYKGVAPQAKILAVKVAGASGATDVSNVLAAIQWVVSYKDTYNIKVLNLSLSTDSSQTYRTDPFNYAVERAWDAGIVVVVSASNRGPSAATISKPADDPLVITIGSTDDRGTSHISDDELPDFSSRGPTVPDGLSKPDVVAPGAHMMSLRSPGSTIDTQFPSPDTGAYRRGSGTSFSAAAVSGVAALMLSRRPTMTPDQVKYALVGSARVLPAGSDPLVVGAGEVDAATAVLNPPSGTANQGVVRSNGTGLLPLSRGHVSVQTVGVPTTVVNGALTAQLVLWSPVNYLLPWTPSTWLVSTWALTPWLAVTWDDDDWSGRNWGGRNWGGGDWQGASWGATADTGRDYGAGTDGALWFGAWG
jgi:serine protease AprX